MNSTLLPFYSSAVSFRLRSMPVYSVTKHHQILVLKMRANIFLPLPTVIIQQWDWARVQCISEHYGKKIKEIGEGENSLKFPFAKSVQNKEQKF